MGSCLGIKSKKEEERYNNSSRRPYYRRPDNRVRMEKMEGIHRPVARLNV